MADMVCQSLSPHTCVLQTILKTSLVLGVGIGLGIKLQQRRNILPLK